MKRMHLFELEDQTWFPSFLKDNIRDYLKFMVSCFGLYRPAEKEIGEVIDQSGCRTVVDLCAGSGGNTLEIQERLNTGRQEKIKVYITDLYPNRKASQFFCERFLSSEMEYVEVAVDATNVPAQYKGLRTIFTAFHHFSPARAKKILQDAVSNNSPISIFEFNHRGIVDFLLILLFTPLFVWMVTPFIRPFRWDRLLFTYVVPLLPLAIWWDAIVSTLRAYSPDELMDLTKDINQKVSWRSGYLRDGFVRVTYLTGLPVFKN